jgi:hypothetical protein
VCEEFAKRCAGDMLLYQRVVDQLAVFTEFVQVGLGKGDEYSISFIVNWFARAFVFDDAETETVMVFVEQAGGNTMQWFEKFCHIFLLRDSWIRVGSKLQFKVIGGGESAGLKVVLVDGNERTFPQCLDVVGARMDDDLRRDRNHTFYIVILSDDDVRPQERKSDGRFAAFEVDTDFAARASDGTVNLAGQERWEKFLAIADRDGFRKRGYTWLTCNSKAEFDVRGKVPVTDVLLHLFPVEADSGYEKPFACFMKLYQLKIQNTCLAGNLRQIEQACKTCLVDKLGVIWPFANEADDIPQRVTLL